MNEYFQSGSGFRFNYLPDISVYRRARKLAKIDPETAAKEFGIERRTLDAYELMERPTPADIAKKMAEFYNYPQLIPEHCRFVCPLGSVCGHTISDDDLRIRVFKLVTHLKNVLKQEDKLANILLDGQVDMAELNEFQDILDEIEAVENEAAGFKFTPYANAKTAVAAAVCG